MSPRKKTHVANGLNSQLSIPGMPIQIYPDPAPIVVPGLVNIQKTMEHYHAINGKIHYFYEHFQ